MKRTMLGALLALGILTTAHAQTPTNEIGPTNVASFRTTGTLLISVTDNDSAGKQLRNWTKITRMRFVALGAGAGGTVSLQLYLKNGWTTLTLDDTAEWSEEVQFRSPKEIDNYPAGQRPDSIAVMTMGGVSGQLILEGEGG